MTSKVLSVRVDSELLDRLNEHAARRQVTVQDYVVSLLVRDDFDERFKSAVEETDRFYSTPQLSADSAQATNPPGSKDSSPSQDIAFPEDEPRTQGGSAADAHVAPTTPRAPETAGALWSHTLVSPHLAQGHWSEQTEAEAKGGLGWASGAASGSTEAHGRRPGGWT